ncbi:hypothetical protein I8J29_22110 [Paenibacillus sp. MWE-103]|uniref:Uncharacterized protein n=1 Tax=Paenibacillus artemisiicola TaxID=1172618 RepID=A0ABS3WF23_9BACL|nr:hypothetical protein [Paenibacillus artemisiicola]MBO7746917.1 hypothetical protein [Paenibacillus artemisiicola]
MNAFWSHTVWYLLLGLATLIQVVYALYRSENRFRTFAFYLSLVGLPLYFETFIMIFLHAYVYCPRIIQNPKLDPFNDSLAGNLFSQFGVASSALLLIIRRKPFYWHAVVALVYAMVEVLFVHLDIYRHHWWRTWMTFLALLVFFAISKWMHAHLVKGVRSLYFKGYLILGMFPICTILLLWGVLDLSGYMRFTTSLFPNHPRISRYGLYQIFTMASYSLVLWGYFRRRRVWRIATVTSLGTLIYMGYRSHLLVFREGYVVPVGILMIVWMHFAVCCLDALYGRRQQER